MVSLRASVASLLGMTLVVQMLTAQVGPVYFRNTSNEAVTLEADYSVAKDGRRGLQGVSWVFAADQQAYLAIDDKKVVASELFAWITTADGSTYWSFKCSSLDSDGDAILEFSQANLREHYEVLRKRPILGVEVADGKGGVEITSVSADSASARAGLESGDVITKLDEQPVVAVADLRSYLSANKAPGDTVKLMFRRGNQERMVSVRLSAASTKSLPPIGPSQQALERAIVKVVASGIAWWLVDSNTSVPKEGFEELARQMARSLGSRALEEAMFSAASDLAPGLAARDQRVLAGLLASTITGEGGLVPRGATRDTLFRLLRAQGMSQTDADFLAGAAASLVASIHGAR